MFLYESTILLNFLESITSSFSPIFSSLSIDDSTYSKISWSRSCSVVIFKLNLFLNLFVSNRQIYSRFASVRYLFDDADEDENSGLRGYI